MSDPKPRRLAISIFVGVALLTTSGWFAHREISCARLVEHAQNYPDAEVRRGAAGVCRVCREAGPLYDIAFDHCSQAEPLYAGLRVP